MDGWTLLHQADGMDGNGCTDLHFHPFHPFEKVRGVDRHTDSGKDVGVNRHVDAPHSEGELAIPTSLDKAARNHESY